MICFSNCKQVVAVIDLYPILSFIFFTTTQIKKEKEMLIGEELLFLF